MGYTLENIKQFFEDHPGFFSQNEQQGIMNTARANTSKGLVSTGLIQKLLGNYFEIFLKDTATSEVHIKIGQNALLGVRPNSTAK